MGFSVRLWVLVPEYGGLVTDYGGFSQIMGFSARLWGLVPDYGV